MARQKETTRQQVPTIFLLLPFLVVIVGLLFVPVLALIIKSISNNNVFTLELLDPGLLAKTSWTLAHYARIFSQPYYVTALFETLFIAFAGVILSAIVGIPVAYIFSTRRKSSLVEAARFIITMPIFIPDIVICYSLLGFLGRQGVINLLLSKVGLHMTLVYNVPSVIIGTFYILFSPFVVIVVASMERIDWSLLEASFTLGGSEFTTFCRVILPLVWPGILAGSLVTFSGAVGFIVIAMVLGGGSASIKTLPLEIMAKASSNGDIPLASAMATLLLVITLISQVIVNKMHLGMGAKSE